MAQLWDEFSVLDQPELLQFIFYPRRDFSGSHGPANAVDCSITVDEGVAISCRFYFGNENYPSILFFHGNGEIASDYDDIGLIYNQMGINLFVADYRGYGMSGGTPTLTSMIKDAHPIFEGFNHMIKHAADFQIPLLTANERVNKAFEVITTGKDFTEEQHQWLAYIREHLTENLAISEEDFEIMPVFERHGGLGKAKKVFGSDDLSKLIRDLNANLAA